MSTNEQIPTGESGAGEFEWVPPESALPNQTVGAWRPPPKTPTFRRVVDAALIEFKRPEWTNLLPNIFVVGVSGGVDSIVLLHVLVYLRREGVFSAPLTVVHYDHQLRDDSHLDAEFVRRLAEQWGLLFTLDTEPMVRTDRGVEHDARTARYEALIRACDARRRPFAKKAIAVGHHANDVAETVLMHMVRGSGLEGVASMRQTTHLENVNFRPLLMRPFIRVKREDILAYAIENRLSWREDPTNSDTHITRNYIRHEVMPKLTAMNGDAAVAFERLARIATYESARLKRLTESQVKILRTEETLNTRFILDANEYSKLPIEDRIACLRLQIRRIFTNLDDIGIDELEELALALGESASAQPFATTGPHPWYFGLSWSTFTRPPVFGKTAHVFAIHGSSQAPWAPAGPWIENEDEDLLRRRFHLPWTIRLANGWALMVQNRGKIKSRKLNPPQNAIWINADSVKSIRLAVFEPGMSIVPLGMGGKSKSVGNLFTDKKVPKVLRPHWPVVLDGDTGEVIWVSWLAQAESTRVSNETKAVWECVWLDEGLGPNFSRNYDYGREPEGEAPE